MVRRAHDFVRWLPLGGATAYGLLSNKFGDTNMLVRKDLFHRLGGFDDDGLEDWLFLSRAALEGIEIDVVPEPLFLYRVWDGSYGRAFSAEIATHRRCAPYLRDRIYRLARNASLHDRPARTANAQPASEVVDELNRERVSARFARAKLNSCWGQATRGDFGCNRTCRSMPSMTEFSPVARDPIRSPGFRGIPLRMSTASSESR